MRASFFTATALAISTIGLTGCGDSGTDTAATAEEGTIPGLSVTNARVVLAPVEGNPAAVYFDLSYDGDRNLAIRRADVEGAGSAMLHEYAEYDMQVQMMEALPVPVTSGSTVSFEPGGLHVMAMDPSPELQPGGTTDVTLTVAGGDSITFPAEIRAAGEER